MTPGLDALLAALCVLIDDHVAPRRRIGRPPNLTNAELLRLAMAQVLLAFCALPRAEFTGMSILLTEFEDRYPPGVVTVDINSPGMLGFH